MIIVDVVIGNECADFAQIHQKSQFAVGFPLGRDCAGVQGKGSVVMIPYLCMRASPTVRSSLRFIRTGRLCV